MTSDEYPYNTIWSITTRDHEGNVMHEHCGSLDDTCDSCRPSSSGTVEGLR